MDIRDSIRKQFSKKPKLQEATKWNPDNQPNIYELDNFLRKSGYRLIDIIEHKESSLSHSLSHNYELIIEPITPGYLHPSKNFYHGPEWPCEAARAPFPEGKGALAASGVRKGVGRQEGRRASGRA